MSNILVINGPNLNLLGSREPEIYGSDSLETIHSRLSALASASNIGLDFYQSNAEHELISKIHQAQSNNTQFIIFNPAAYTHTSVALRDALLGVNIPFLELHISNVFKREAFRHQSYFSDIAVGIISGLGTKGYDAAMHYALDTFNTDNKV